MKSIILSKDVSSRRFFYFLVTALTSIVLISGCSKDLSRNEAKEIIINYFKYPISATKELDLGSKIMANRMSTKWLATLEREGLINYTYHNRLATDHVVSVLLTDKGKEYVVGDIGTRGWLSTGPKYVKVKFAEKQFVEISGIRTPGDKKEAAVEYTWKYGNLTPFSKDWKDESLSSVRTGSGSYDENKTHKDQVYMALYDDGWRIRK
jgi:hypothetical protein